MSAPDQPERPEPDLTDVDAGGPPASTSGLLLGVEPGDELEELDTPLTRLASWARRLVAAAVVAAMLVPASAWLLDELDFRRSGQAVVDTVEGELSGTDAGATVLLVRTVGCGGAAGSGSAFVVDGPDGPVVVTNRHVVDGATQVTLRTLGGDIGAPVEQVRTAAAADVGVLEVADPDGLPQALRLRDTPATADEEVRIVGFPAARPFTDVGHVAQTRAGRLLLDVDVAPGASGSPVVDAQGTVVGQVHAVTSGGQGVATPAAALRSAIADATPHQPRC